MNDEPPIVESGTWGNNNDGTIVVTLDQKNGEPLAEPETIYFRLQDGVLTSTICDRNLYGSEGLVLTRQ